MSRHWPPWTAGRDGEPHEAAVLPLRRPERRLGRPGGRRTEGRGTPDTLCDAVAERASQLYVAVLPGGVRAGGERRFDKVMLIGGEATTATATAC